MSGVLSHEKSKSGTKLNVSGVLAGLFRSPIKLSPWTDPKTPNEEHTWDYADTTPSL